MTHRCWCCGYEVESLLTELYCARCSHIDLLMEVQKRRDRGETWSACMECKQYKLTHNFTSSLYCRDCLPIHTWKPTTDKSLYGQNL